MYSFLRLREIDILRHLDLQIGPIVLFCRLHMYLTYVSFFQDGAIGLRLLLAILSRACE